MQLQAQIGAFWSVFGFFYVIDVSDQELKVTVASVIELVKKRLKFPGL